MRGWEADGGFTPYGGIGVRSSADHECPKSGHARSNSTISFDCEPRSDQALDRRMRFKWREPQLLCKVSIGGLFTLKRHQFKSHRQILRF